MTIAGTASVPVSEVRISARKAEELRAVSSLAPDSMTRFQRRGTPSCADAAKRPEMALVDVPSDLASLTFTRFLVETEMNASIRRARHRYRLRCP